MIATAAAASGDVDASWRECAVGGKGFTGSGTVCNKLHAHSRQPGTVWEGQLKGCGVRRLKHVTISQ